MNLTELSKQIRFDNASKGFDPTDGGVERYLLLAISEICEAQDELRDGRDITEVYYVSEGSVKSKLNTKNGKPCGFPVEIADAIIRLLDICGKFDIRIQEPPDITSFRWTEPIDYYLLLSCNQITECQFGFFVGIVTVKCEHALNNTITLLIQLSKYHQIDIMKVIEEKLAYNRQRPPKHGRKF